MKTILIVTERFYPEEFRINDLALSWKNQGYRVKVITQFPGYPSGKLFYGYKNRLFWKEHWRGIEIYRVFTVMGYRTGLICKLMNYFNHAFLASVFAIPVARNCDVVFVYHTGPLTNVIPAVIVGKLFKKSIVIWTTDIWPDAVFAYGFKRTAFREKLLGFFVKWIFSNCNDILVSSPGFVGRLKEYVPNKPINYVPHWADESVGTSSHVDSLFAISDQKKFHFTFAGNIGKIQNLENVIEGFSTVTESGRLQLNIIGDGSNLEALKEQVRKKRLQNVVFMGRKPGSEMHNYYAASDVLLIPLKGDPAVELTVPGKFQTCLRAGKPVFAIMNGTVRELVEEHGLGIAADPDSVLAIREGFSAFAKLGEEELSRIGENNASFYAREFNRESIMKTISDHIDATPLFQES